MRATDVLRFGYLLRHEGRWGDQQLVAAEYVRTGNGEGHSTAGPVLRHVGRAKEFTR